MAKCSQFADRKLRTTRSGIANAFLVVAKEASTRSGTNTRLDGIANLYRAIDSAGNTVQAEDSACRVAIAIDFMLSPKRDLTAAKLFLRQSLTRPGVKRPRVINVDGHPAYARAIADLKCSGELGRRCRCRPSPYLNNNLEQDHRFIKKRITAGLWFGSVQGALRTIEGYEAMHLIRKGQIRWLAKGDVVGQRQFIHSTFGIPA